MTDRITRRQVAEQAAALAGMTLVAPAPTAPRGHDIVTVHLDGETARMLLAALTAYLDPEMPRTLLTALALALSAMREAR